MIPLQDRRHLLELIRQAHHDGASLYKACEIAGITLRTLQRWQMADGSIRADARPQAQRPTPSHALSQAERAEVLRIANEPRFAEQPPARIVPALADEGRYVASESTFYRILRAQGQAAHRGRAKAPQAHRSPTTHVASGARQVWCWDMTYLPAQIAGHWFYLYLILDLYSRKIVGWEVHEQDDSQHAAHLVRRTALAEGIADLFRRQGTVARRELRDAGRADQLGGILHLLASLDGPPVDLVHDLARMDGGGRRAPLDDGVGQGPQVFVGDLGQLEVAELGLQVPLIDRAPHVAGGLGHLVAAKPLFRPGTERFGVAHTGLLPGFLPGRRLSRRDHLLGFGQAFPGLGQRDPARPVSAEGDGLLPPVEGVVVAERNGPGGGDGHIQAVPVRHLVQLARRLEVPQLGIGQHGSHAPLQHHASCALLEPKEHLYKSTAYRDTPMAQSM